MGKRLTFENGEPVDAQTDDVPDGVVILEDVSADDLDRIKEILAEGGDGD